MVEMWLDESDSGHPNEAVERMDCSLLIVRGDKDHLVSRSVVFELAEMIKDANLFNIAFAEHEAFIDQKEVFTSILKEFFSTENES